ncbi:DUF685 domain-containing protein [Borreliella burgdorferi]
MKVKQVWLMSNQTLPQGLSSRFPMYKGWYIQKRAYLSGGPIPQLLKL